MKIPENEQNALKALSTKALIQALEADKAVALAKIADLEYQNATLAICLKYNVSPQALSEPEKKEEEKNES